MVNICIGRYDNPSQVGGWSGWIEPSTKDWILFIAEDGSTAFFPHRGPGGGVVSEQETDDAPLDDDALTVALGAFRAASAAVETQVGTMDPEWWTDARQSRVVGELRRYARRCKRRN
jgi:hypothetical protein